MYIVVIASLVLLGLASCQGPPYACDSEIYCHGPLLETVQLRRIFEDSKTFVDMKLKQSPTVTLEKFHAFMEEVNQNPSDAEVKQFVDENFDAEGSEFEDWVPEDWTANPKFIENIKSESYRNFSLDLNDIWKQLGRKMKPEVEQNSELYSIIPIPHPVIVPGGRFREVYYWDSYWIIQGLLHSEMTSTVKGMLINFAHMIENIGHIPNGGRIYYEQRSQPPLYIPMVKLYVTKTNDMQFVSDNIATFEREMQYWLSNHLVSVEVNNKSYNLLIYGDKSQGPRPESYREDYNSAQSLGNETEKEAHYSELKAAAESGWDFSSRWFNVNGTNKGNLTNIKTRSIVPVDLNAIFYMNSVILSEWFDQLGNTEKADYFKSLAADWLLAVDEVLWHKEAGIWYDYDLDNKKPREYFYPSNLIPLWADCYAKEQTDEIVQNVLNYMKSENDGEGVILDGGIPTSLEQTGEQWDFPNAWPPLQHMVIVGLHNTNNKDAQQVAYDLADTWVKSNYIAYSDKKHMYEKYDATSLGGHGGGGEYEVQLGFGWSNGVVLDLLYRYGADLSYNDQSSAINPKSFGKLATWFISALATGLASRIG